MAHKRFDEGQWSAGELFGPDDYWMVSWGPHPLDDIEDPDHCACCGKKLSWRVLCVNTETSEKAVLGSRCAVKASLPGVPASDKDAKVALAKKLLNDREFERWAGFKPHPKNFRGRSLADDLAYLVSRKPERVFSAVKDFHSEGPVPAYDPEAPVALTYGLKDKKVDVRFGWTSLSGKGKCWVAMVTGTHERFGFNREFAPKEFGPDGCHCLTNKPGVYEVNVGQTRSFFRLNEDGSAEAMEEAAVASLVAA
jgi:hypothetical protein